TASEFMVYLAAILGRTNPDKFLPMTDSKAQLETVVNSGLTRAQAKYRPIRLEVLNNLFPVPRGRINAKSIDTFKTKRGKNLRGFREYIEAEVRRIAAIQDDDLRKEYRSRFNEKLKKRVSDIRAQIDDHFGRRASILGKMCFGAATKFSKVAGVTKAILDACPDEEDYEAIPAGAILYAAYAQSELLLVEEDE
ncbi:MAG: hypothetical protein AAGB04_31225, partial [Pseudomonadota bacterium]